jgi:DNA-binding response OmpR family regulator
MILFLDDETYITDVYCKLIQKKYGFEVDAFNSPKRALEALKKSPGLYDIIIADFKMPEMDGLRFSRKVRENDTNTKIMICTGDPELISEKEACDTDLFSILKKPLQGDEIAAKIKAARQGI